MNKTFRQLPDGSYETTEGQSIEYGFDPIVDDPDDLVECSKCQCLCHKSQVTKDGPYYLCEHCE